MSEEVALIKDAINEIQSMRGALNEMNSKFENSKKKICEQLKEEIVNQFPAIQGKDVKFEKKPYILWGIIVFLFAIVLYNVNIDDLMDKYGYTSVIKCIILWLFSLTGLLAIPNLMRLLRSEYVL